MAKEIKKYFLKDEEVSNVDLDVFRHRDYADNIFNIISNEQPPFNIAIIGKWGLGKTSLINLVKNRFVKDKRVEFVKLNAWKYEKDALRRVFLKNVWLVADPDAEQRASKETHWLEALKKLFEFQNVKKKFFNKKSICILVFALIASILIFWGYKQGVDYVYSENYTKPYGFWKTIIEFIASVLPTLLSPAVTVFIAGLVFNAIKGSKNLINLPLETEDDYEEYAKKAIEKSKINKFVIIVDDLDRLSPEKIVEALDAIKAFVDMPNCVFLIPFDDSILKEALQLRRRVSKTQTGNKTADSELILDKLFQYKVYLPPLPFLNLKEYAIDLVNQNLIDFMDDYFLTKEEFEFLLKNILIHTGVKTPRQVKKLVNAFVMNYKTIKDREGIDEIEKGLLTTKNGIEMVAKISVLQTDFNEFYDSLFEDSAMIQKLIDKYKEPKDISKDDAVYSYFNDNDGELTFKNEHIDLVNFLRKTITVEVGDILPYLYLTQSKVSKKIGDKVYQDFSNALISSNEKRTSELLQSNNTLEHHIPDIVDNLDNVKDIENSLFCLMENYQDFNGKAHIANLVAKQIRNLSRMGNELEFLHKVSPANAFNIFTATNDENKNRYYEQYIKSLQNNDALGEVVKTAITLFAGAVDTLDNEKTILLKQLVTFAIDKCQYEQLLSFVNLDKEKFAEVFDFNLADKIIQEIISYDDFSEDVLEKLGNLLGRTVNTSNINKNVSKLLLLFERPQISAKVDAWFTEELCKGIDAQNATVIAEKIIEIWSITKNGDTLFSMLSKLKYKITSDNSEGFDEFVLNFETTPKMQSVLKYACQNKYFSLLPRTGDKLIEIIFDDNSYDKELLICLNSLSEEQIDTILTKINDGISVNENDYTNVIRIITNIKDRIEEELDGIATTLLSTSQFQARYIAQYRDFVDFVNDYFNICQDNIGETNFTNYYNILKTYFTSYADIAIDAIWNTKKHIGESFATIFEQIKTTITASNVDKIFDIVEENKDKFNNNTGISNSEYLDVIFDIIEVQSNPNAGVTALGKFFKWISSVSKLANLVATNDNIDKDNGTSIISKFIKGKINDNKINIASDDILKILKINGCNFTISIVDKLNDTEQKVILAGCVESISDETLSGIVPIFDFILSYKNTITIDIILSCLEKLLDVVDENFEVAYTAFEKLKSLNMKMDKNSKEKLAQVMFKKFTNSTSDNLRKNIVHNVSVLRLKREFKSLIGDDDDKTFYEQNIA